MGRDQPYCVIPARYASSRFPGKPLHPLLGKPMVLWVAEACEKAVGKARVIVATDDVRIQAVAQRAGFQVEITSATAPTGTDRVAEVAKRIGGSTVLNVQGDEPMVDPRDIMTIANFHAENPSLVVNGFIPLSENEDPARATIPKVVMDLGGRLLYISRRDIPGSKVGHSSGESSSFLKQVCIYAFSPNQLMEFSSTPGKTRLENIEDIEILRFLELGQKVQMLKMRSPSLAVDVPEDVDVVEAAMIREGFRPGK